MKLSSSILLLAEDSLGLALGRRLIQEHAGLSIWRETNARGYGAIKRDILKYDNMGKNGFPVLALTDLDHRACCRLLIEEWFHGSGPHPNLLLRICVRESESWLLADAEALANLLRLPPTRMPTQPDNLADPKECLLALVASSSKKMRRGLLPPPDSTAKIGPEYNDLLCHHVNTSWEIAKAAERSPSLAKARHRLSELAARVGTCRFR